MYHWGNCGSAPRSLHAQHPTEKSCALINVRNMPEKSTSDSQLQSRSCWHSFFLAPAVPSFFIPWWLCTLKNHTPWVLLFHKSLPHSLLVSTMYVHTECRISVRRFCLYPLDHTSSSTAQTRLKSCEGSPHLKQVCPLHIWASCGVFYDISPYYSLVLGGTLNPLFAFWCDIQEHLGSLK